jgi:hypothetical protein
MSVNLLGSTGIAGDEMPAVSVTTFALATGLYTTGSYQGVIDTPPGNANSARFFVNNAAWPAGTSITFGIDFSYDGGLTYPDSVTCTCDSTPSTDNLLPLGTVACSMGFRVTADSGTLIPDHARFTIVVPVATTLSASAGWV